MTTIDEIYKTLYGQAFNREGGEHRQYDIRSIDDLTSFIKKKNGKEPIYMSIYDYPIQENVRKYVKKNGDYPKHTFDRIVLDLDISDYDILISEGYHQDEIIKTGENILKEMGKKTTRSHSLKTGTDHLKAELNNKIASELKGLLKGVKGEKKRNEVIRDYYYTKFSSGEYLGTPFKDAIKVADYLHEAYGIEPLLFTSGNKGVHIHILFNEIDIPNADEVVEAFGRTLEDKLNVTLDKKVYQTSHSRMIRVPGSMHQDTKLYVMPFTRHTSYVEMVDLAKEPTPMVDVVLDNDTTDFEALLKNWSSFLIEKEKDTSVATDTSSLKYNYDGDLKELQEPLMLMYRQGCMETLGHSLTHIFYGADIPKNEVVSFFETLPIQQDMAKVHRWINRVYDGQALINYNLGYLVNRVKEEALTKEDADTFIKALNNFFNPSKPKTEDTDGMTYFTSNIVQVENSQVLKDGLYKTFTNDDGERDYSFYGNILIHNLTVTYDKLGLFPQVVSLEYTNTMINQRNTIERKPFSTVANEISKNLLIDTNSQGIESTLRKIFIHSGNTDLGGNVSVNADTDLLKDGFFYDEDIGKVVSNNVFNNLNTTDDDVREAIKLFNEIIKDRKTAISNDCSLFRFMLWSPFGYCLKQIGYTDDLYSMVLWGVTDSNKTGSSVIFSNLYADRDTTLQKASTQSAMGTRLGENTFPLILDENKDILSDPHNEEFLKNIVYDKIGRSVKDRADNNAMNDFPALRMTISTLNPELEYKDEFLKRYKVLYYDTSMQVTTKRKTAFNKKFMPNSPNTPLKQLKHLGKAFADRFIPYIEAQSEELYDLEGLTIKVLKQIQTDYGQDFNMNVFIQQKLTHQSTDKASIIRNGLNRLFSRVHKVKYGQNEPMGSDFQRCAKTSEISWLDYKPKKEVYYIKVSEFEKEVSDILGEHIPVADTLKLLEIPVSEVKKRKFKSSTIPTVVIGEYNLTYKMFNINIYDADTLEDLQEKETFIKMYDEGKTKEDIMEALDMKEASYEFNKKNWIPSEEEKKEEDKKTYI